MNEENPCQLSRLCITELGKHCTTRPGGMDSPGIKSMREIKEKQSRTISRLNLLFISNVLTIEIIDFSRVQKSPILAPTQI